MSSTRPFPDLPEEVAEVVGRSSLCEFATLTAKGIPLDTPLSCLPNADHGTVEVTTGLAYPAKAERARRNPRVGMLHEGRRGSAVVATRALAAVHDADVQENADRFIRWAAPSVGRLSRGKSWEEIRGAVWYWSRIFIECTPVQVLWWPTGDTDRQPQRWEAPPGTTARASDPPPPGPPSPAPRWPVADWSERAAEVVAMDPPHLALVDGEGFPLVLRVRAAERTETGFRLDVPAGHPWPELSGVGSLSFGGRGTFVGQVEPGSDGATFAVRRILPDLPLVLDSAQVFEPSPETRKNLMERLAGELARRRQSVPHIPESLPTS